MTMPKRIFIIADVSTKSIKMYINQMPKLAKGLIRLGHDARIFSYCNILEQLSPLKSKTLSKRLFKSKLDTLLVRQIKDYMPDIIYISFPRSMDAETIDKIKAVVPMAKVIGLDGDPWPKLQKDDRVEMAKKMDVLTVTNDGQFLQDYLDAGVKQCVFMPNMCDPDMDHRYEVAQDWNTDILWTGAIEHHADTSENLRRQLLERLVKRNNCRIYGCLDYPKIGGIDYLYAISGAKVGLSVNAVNDVSRYHSDRLTHYLSCGTFVLAKRVPDSELLFKDGTHLRYFDTVDEFFELADWYLKHNQERVKIANAGMAYAHKELSCLKMAGYIIDLIEKGTYDAPWNHSM